MRKIGLLASALLIVMGASAQGFYIRAGLGYAVPQASQTMYDTPIPYNGFPTGISGSRNNTSSTTYTYNIKGASFSAGLQSSIGIGYMFSRHVGMQLDALIGLSAKKYTFNDENFNLGTSASPLPGTISTVQQCKTPVFLVPALVLQSGGDKVNLYSRFGIALPFNTKVTQDQVLSNNPGTGLIQVDDYTWQIKSSFSLGFTAAVGVKYKISDVISVWGELSLLSMSVYTKEQDLKSIAVNGQSYPTSNYNYASTIKFSKSASVDSNLASLPAYSQPFSNVGINVGVTFMLSHHERSSSRRNDDDIDRSKPFKRR